MGYFTYEMRTRTVPNNCCGFEIKLFYKKKLQTDTRTLTYLDMRGPIVPCSPSEDLPPQAGHVPKRLNLMKKDVRASTDTKLISD